MASSSAGQPRQRLALISRVAQLDLATQFANACVLLLLLLLLLSVCLKVDYEQAGGRPEMDFCIGCVCLRALEFA